MPAATTLRGDGCGGSGGGVVVATAECSSVIDIEEVLKLLYLSEWPEPIAAAMLVVRFDFDPR